MRCNSSSAWCRPFWLCIETKFATGVSAYKMPCASHRPWVSISLRQIQKKDLISIRISKVLKSDIWICILMQLKKLQKKVLSFFLQKNLVAVAFIHADHGVFQAVRPGCAAGARLQARESHSSADGGSGWIPLYLMMSKSPLHLFIVILSLDVPPPIQSLCEGF